jgi:predicted N-acetyltransferase YhbS
LNKENQSGGAARIFVASSILRTVSTLDAPRAATAEEWPRLRDAANRVFRPDGSGDLFAQSPLLFDPANREGLRVLTRQEDGAVVAHAGFVMRDAWVYRRRIRVACLGAVFTLAEHRKQGLATRVLLDALRLARRGTDLVLASGDRDLYRRQGLEPVPPLTRFCIAVTTAPNRSPASAATSTPTSTSEGIGVREVRPGDAQDLAALAALYDAEEVRFARSPADWERILAAGLLVDAPSSVWLVSRAGATTPPARPVAYLAVQRAGTRSDGSTRPRRILELAGDRQAAVAAAPLVADELLCPAYDTATAALAERRGWTRTVRQFLITAEALTVEVVVIPWYGFNYL